MKMSEDEAFKQIRLVLLREWDPLFVARRKQYAEDREDEYDGYARAIAGMLLRGATSQEILEYLEWAETTNMELSFSEKNARSAADTIAALIG